jgi:hypothetical protein
MEVKSKIFIVVACWLIMATMAMAALQRLPLCKKQKDLTGPFARILKKYKESVGKRPKREVGEYLICSVATLHGLKSSVYI